MNELEKKGLSVWECQEVSTEIKGLGYLEELYDIESDIRNAAISAFKKHRSYDYERLAISKQTRFQITRLLDQLPDRLADLTIEYWEASIADAIRWYSE